MFVQLSPNTSDSSAARATSRKASSSLTLPWRRTQPLRKRGAQIALDTLHGGDDRARVTDVCRRNSGNSQDTGYRTRTR
eukprot:5258361-Pyramimonas_sp.AAC.1